MDAFLIRAGLRSRPLLTRATLFSLIDTDDLLARMDVLRCSRMEAFGGPWSLKKLDCVESYAVNYLKVMQNQAWSLHYVDAFAGQGRQQLKTVSSDPGFLAEDEEARIEFLEGSAMRALKVSSQATRGFDRFIFIEASHKAKEKLAERARSEWPGHSDRIQVVEDDANKALVDYAKNTNWRQTRALVFLDPFGLQVRWETIEALAQTRACDIWYLFPIGGVIRMLPSSGRWIHAGKPSLMRCLVPLTGEMSFLRMRSNTTFLAMLAGSRVRMKIVFLPTFKRECAPYLPEFRTLRYCATQRVIPCLPC